MSVTFEEGAGVVPVTIERRSPERIWCELQAPQPLSVGRTFPAAEAGAAVSLAPGDLRPGAPPPTVASVGLPFLFVELNDRQALRRARPDVAGFERLLAEGLDPTFVHLFVRGQGDIDLHARMFAPLDGPPEDPATGSANCALAAWLAHLDTAPGGDLRWRIAQGDDMGRASLLEARVEKRDGDVVHAWIGGESVLVGEGRIDV
jgi:trans-2,3-dihydro-3-hydroxyanthranilate isomerase